MPDDLLPVRRVGRPKTLDIDWNDPKAVNRYQRERRLRRKQQPAPARRALPEVDTDLVWGGEGGARLWGLPNANAFYYKAAKGQLPGVKKFGTEYASSRKARERAFAESSEDTTA